VDRGERRSALIGRVVVNELASRPLDDSHLGLAPARGGVPEQRRDKGAADAQQQGKVDAM
jgi:hypothetical protein